MSDTQMGAAAGQSVSADEALAAIRQGQSAEFATITACMKEAQSLAADDSMPPLERQSRVRNLRRLRNRANEALRELEDAERSLVQTSSYAQDAVAALRDSASALTQEIGKTERISDRIDGISNAVGKVVVVADNVLSRASGTGGA